VAALSSSSEQASPAVYAAAAIGAAAAILFLICGLSWRIRQRRGETATRSWRPGLNTTPHLSLVSIGKRSQQPAAQSSSHDPSGSSTTATRSPNRRRQPSAVPHWDHTRRARERAKEEDGERSPLSPTALKHVQHELREELADLQAKGDQQHGGDQAEAQNEQCTPLAALAPLESKRV